MVARTDDQIKYITPLFQLVLIAITSLILLVIIKQRVDVFRSYETEAAGIKFTPNVENRGTGAAGDILTGMYIHEFRAFDVIRKTFSFAAVVWFSFDPELVTLKDIESFDFLSAHVDHRSAPILKMIDGKKFVAYEVVISMYPQLNYSDFPLNDHRLFLTLINTALSSDKVTFTTANEDFVVAADQTNIGWLLVDQVVKTGSVKTELDPVNQDQDLDFPAVMFELDYSQFNVRDLLTLFWPLLMLCFIGTFGFSVKKDIAFTIIPVTVTAILAYRFVIDSLSPRVGYFMLMDKMFLLILGLSGASLVMMIVEAHKEEHSLLSTKITLISIHLILVISLFLFIR